MGTASCTHGHIFKIYQVQILQLCSQFQIYPNFDSKGQPLDLITTASSLLYGNSNVFTKNLRFINIKFPLYIGPRPYLGAEKGSQGLSLPSLSSFSHWWVTDGCVSMFVIPQKNPWPTGFLRRKSRDETMAMYAISRRFSSFFAYLCSKVTHGKHLEILICTFQRITRFEIQIPGSSL